MDDQRSTMRPAAAPTLPDDDFFNLVQQLQSNRLETQRSTMPTSISSSSHLADSTSTVSVGDKRKKLNRKNTRV